MRGAGRQPGAGSPSGLYGQDPAGSLSRFCQHSGDRAASVEPCLCSVLQLPVPRLSSRAGGEMPLLRGRRGPSLPWGAWLSHGAGQSTAEGCRAAPRGPFVVPGSPTAGILKDRGVGLFQRPASRWWRGRGSGVRSPVGAVSQGTVAWGCDGAVPPCLGVRLAWHCLRLPLVFTSVFLW